MEDQYDGVHIHQFIELYFGSENYLAERILDLEKIKLFSAYACKTQDRQEMASFITSFTQKRSQTKTDGYVDAHSSQ